MKIYVTGLIFFNGCNEDVKGMFAPDGRQDLPEGIPVHQASLWIAPEHVVGSETAWWPGREGAVRSHDIDGATVLEFRIMDPAKIEFPDLNNGDPNCDELDKKLPKLKKKKKNGATLDFEIDLDAAETIAEVMLRGGTVTPCLLEKKIHFVEWTIDNPSSLQIIAKLQDGDSVAGTITLNNLQAEIVFSNTHDVFVGGEEKKDRLAGDHTALFQKLNPEADISVFSEKAKKDAADLITVNRFANYLFEIKYGDGDTPPCCPN